MKSRPKHCFQTLAILGCIGAVLLSASVVVVDVVVVRLMQKVRAGPETAPTIKSEAHTPPEP